MVNSEPFYKGIRSINIKQPLKTACNPIRMERSPKSKDLLILGTIKLRQFMVLGVIRHNHAEHVWPRHISPPRMLKLYNPDV